MTFSNTHRCASGCADRRTLETMARDTVPEEEFTDDIGVGNFHENIEFGLSDDGNDGDDERDWTDESGSSDQGVDGNDEDANDDPYGGKDDGKNSNNRRNGHTGSDNSYRLRVILVCLVTGIVMAAVSSYFQKMFTVQYF